MYVHVEREVAEKLGLSRATIRAVREKVLVRGRDYDLEGGAVKYTDAGLQRVELEVGAKTAAPSTTPSPAENRRGGEGQDSPPPASKAPEGTLRDDFSPQEAVVVRGFRNLRLIQAEIAGRLVRVRVRNSVNFVKGMRIPVRLLNGDLYELARRCPRWRGRW
ncbi:MAG: hypothetical protein FJ222_12485 [Lentisphaerae bacterium]|nr:hypothetical protein [Lentisphaerota bacterium]